MKSSIVVATYNRKEKLKRCLKPLLNQDSASAYEVLLIDDGSTDGTREFLEREVKRQDNLRVFHQENEGPASARNTGIRKAKGEIVFFTDDDVIVPTDWVRTFTDFLDEHEEVGAVGGYLEASDELLEENVFAQYERFVSTVLYERPRRVKVGGFETYGLVTNNAAYRRKALLEAGLFDEDFPVAAGEDADLKLRVALQEWRLAYLPVKAVHIQEYGLGRFWRQQVARGIGNAYFRRKWADTLAGQEQEYRMEAQEGTIKKLFSSKSIGVLALFAISVLAGWWGAWRKSV